MNKMSAIIVLLIFMAPFHAYGEDAGLIRRHLVDREKGHVYFYIKNLSTSRIDKIYGWVYGYDKTAPQAYDLANNPDRPPTRVTSGDHLPGTWALYRFTIFPKKRTFRYYGLTLYDDSVFFLKDARR